MAESLAETGSNGIKPNEYLGIIQEIIADEIEKNKAVGRIRAKMKRLKDAGANLDAISMLRKLSKLDPDERHNRMAALMKYAGWEGVTIFTAGVDPDAQQAELWEEPSPEAKQGHRDAVIHMDGYNSRKAGGSRHDNPQVAGSSDHQMWDRGWLDCEGDLSAQGSTSKVASTERRPRSAKADGENPVKDAAPKRGRKAKATEGESEAGAVH